MRDVAAVPLAYSLCSQDYDDQDEYTNACVQPRRVVQFCVKDAIVDRIVDDVHVCVHYIAQADIVVFDVLVCR